MEFFLRLFDTLSRKRFALAATVALLLLVAAAGASRLQFSEDIFALLPDDEPAVAQARLSLSRFSTLDRMVIALESDDSRTLARAVDDLDAKLRPLPGVKQVISRIDQQAQDEIFALYQGKLPLLFDQSMEEALSARLNRPWFEQRLQQYVDAQAGKEGIKIVDTFRSDPFGFDELALRRFEKLNSGFAGRTDAQGRILSPDGRLAVLFVEPDFPPGNTGRGREFMAQVDGLLADLPEGASAHVIGAHRSSVDNAEVLRTDMHLTIATSVIGIALLFVLGFRSLLPVLLPLLSVSFGFAMALGAQGWARGGLSAITAGFSAVLLGIAVDYAIHLLAAFAGQEGERTPRARAAVGHTGVPSFLAMLTTVAAILMLRLSRFDGLHQLAEMAAVGVFGALLFALLAGPQLLAKWGPRPRPSNPFAALAGGLNAARSKARMPLLAVFALGTVLCAAFFPAVGFDGDVTNLDGKSARTRAAEAAIQTAFGQETLRRTLAISGADTLEGALREGDLAARELHAMGVKFESAAWVLPSTLTQQENLMRWRGFWTQARLADLKTAMTAACARRPDTGASFSFKAAQVEKGFASLWQTVSPGHDPALLQPEQIRKRPVWTLLGNFISERDGRVFSGAVAVMDERQIGELHARVPAALVLNKASFVGRIVQLIRRDLLLMGGLSLLLVVVILWFTFARLADMLIALVPVAGGMVCTLGLMGLLGIPFNIINTLLTVFIAGLGIDYGIFYVQTWRGAGGAEEAARRLRDAGAGVLLAALTTLFGFGTLAMAGHPALFSVGVTTGIGVTTALLLTLFVVPTLLEWTAGPETRHG